MAQEESEFGGVKVLLQVGPSSAKAFAVSLKKSPLSAWLMDVDGCFCLAFGTVANPTGTIPFK